MKLRGSRPGHLRNPIGSKLTRRGRTINDAARVMNDAAIISAARIDPVVFASYVMKDEETGRPIELAPVHIEWHDLLSAHDRVVVWSATELGKTSQISIARVLWEIGRNPNLRIAIVSATIGLAKKIIKSIKTYIERSTEYRRVFPGVVADKSATTGLWKDNAFHVKRDTISKDPTVQAIGFEGAFLGARADLIIIDDYLTPETTFSQHMRDKTHRWLKATVEGRKTARCRFWFVGNAWHRDDAMHRYAKEPGTRSRKYAVRDLLGNSRWPAMWPDARIEKEIANRGPIESQRSMFCNPASDADRRFKESYIVRALQLGDGDRLAHALNHVPTGWRIITGVDLAVSKKDSADMTALVTVAIDRDDNHRVLDIFAARLSGPEIVEKIVEVQRRYSSFVFVESNACFIPGTLVLIKDRGYVPIEQVKIGDLTWTHRGRWRAVTEVLSGPARFVSEVKASGSVPITATPNHWFYLREAGRVPGRDGGHHVPSGKAEWVSCGFVNKRAYAAIAAPKWPRARAVIDLPSTGRISKNKRRIGKGSDSRSITVDNEIAMLLGLWMAEGHKTRAQVVITLGKHEMYLAEWARCVLRRIVPDRVVSITRRVSSITITINSRALALCFASYGKSADKCLPLGWLGWPLELRMSIVRGWLIGDGHVGPNNVRSKSAASVARGGTISRNWAMWVRSTLFDAGMRPTISLAPAKVGSIDGRKIYGKQSWVIQTNPTDTRALIGHTKIERERWGKLIDGRHRRPASTSHHDGKHVWSYLQRGPGEYAGYEGTVWNLEVAGDHSFTANDYIVHNAQRYIKQFVDKRHAMPIRAFNTGKNKTDPAFGIESLATEMGNGKWSLPNDGGTLDGSIPPEVNKLVEQMLSYDPLSHTGDELMATWIAREGGRITKPGGLQQSKRKSLV